MTVTPKGIWTPDASDDWDLTVDLAAMANSIDTAIPTAGTSGIPYAQAAGTATTSAAGNVTVTLPVGRFSVPPIITLNPHNGPNVYTARLASKSAANFQCAAYAAGTTLVAISMDWTAVQMTSSTAAG